MWWFNSEKIFVLVKKYLLIEVLFFIYQAGLAIYQNVFTNGLYWRVCRELYADDLNVNCRRLKDTPEAETAVQQYSASWRIYINCASLVPTIVIGPLLGAFADRNGRKTNILLGATGYIAFGVVYMAVLYYTLPLYLIPLAGALSALTGFGGSFSNSCYAYVADREADKQSLSKRFTYLQVITSLAGIIFGVVTGELLKHLDYVQTYTIHICFTSLAFFYALTLLRQTPPARTRAKAELSVSKVTFDESEIVTSNTPSITSELPSVPVQVFTLFRNAIHTAIQRREGHFRAYVLVVLSSFTVINLTTSGLHSLLNLYVLHSPLSWSASKYADYTSLQSAVSLCGIFVSVVVLKHFHFHETSILLISMASLTLKLLLIGLVGIIPVPNNLYNDIIMYCAAICGLAGDLSYPVATAFVSQLVAHDEVGKIYALFQIAIDLAIILVHTVFNGLYKVTLDIYAGFVFILLAGVMLLCMVPIGWVHFSHSKYQRTSQVDMKF